MARATARELPELIKTSHIAFRPIDVKMGPDGAIYIADWYNPIIQHGEVDFRDPRRDHTHGRIWRMTAKGRPLVPRPQLESTSNTALFKAPSNRPEAYTRERAKRQCSRNAAEVRPISKLGLASWPEKVRTSNTTGSKPCGRTNRSISRRPSCSRRC